MVPWIAISLDSARLKSNLNRYRHCERTVLSSTDNCGYEPLVYVRPGPMQTVFVHNFIAVFAEDFVSMISGNMSLRLTGTCSLSGLVVFRQNSPSFMTIFLILVVKDSKF